MSERTLVGISLLATGLWYGRVAAKRARIISADRAIGPAATRGRSNNTPGVDMLVSQGADIVRPRPAPPVVPGTKEMLRSASSQLAQSVKDGASEVADAARRIARRAESAFNEVASGVAGD